MISTQKPLQALLGIRQGLRRTRVIIRGIRYRNAFQSLRLNRVLLSGLEPVSKALNHGAILMSKKEDSWPFQF